jgi:hypothetical protein
MKIASPIKIAGLALLAPLSRTALLCSALLCGSATAQDDTIAADFFADITLDSPLPRQWLSGETIALRGQTQDIAADVVLFRFTSQADDEISFFINLESGRFERDIVFTHDQAASYVLDVFTFSGDDAPHHGRFEDFEVGLGEGPVSIPARFFSGLSLDAPLPSQLAAGQSLHLEGNLADRTLTQALLQFTPQNDGEPVRFFVAPQDGRLELTLFFSAIQTGTYTLDLFAGQQNESLDFIGGFAPFQILPADGPIDIPDDFFAGITLDRPLATAWREGQAFEVAGSLDDTGLTQVLLQFTPDNGGAAVQFFIEAQDGRFARTLVFGPGQASTYRLDVFAGVAGELLPFLGSFSPFDIAPADGPINIPADYFPGITLDAPLPTTLSTGAALGLNGTVTNPDHTQLMFRLISDRADTVRFLVNATQGRFGRQAVFDHNQDGIYTLEILAGPRNQGLSFVERFTPITIERGTGNIVLPVRFFDGTTLDRPLPTALRFGQTYAFEGTVLDNTVHVQLEIKKNNGEPRYILGGVRDGRLSLPLRLRPDEIGPLDLSLLTQESDGRFYGHGTFRIEGFDGPAPDLEVGVLALQILAGGPGRIPLKNSGDTALTLEVPELVGPFELVRAPDRLEAGETGVVRLLHLGDGTQGELTLRSDDPFQPVVKVALTAFEGTGFPPDLRRFEADTAGRLELEFDRRGDDYIIALYAAQISGLDTAAVYGYGPTPVAAKTATPTITPMISPPATSSAATAGDHLETYLRRHERHLALALRRAGYPVAKRAQIAYAVGDRRPLVFTEFGPVPQQSIETTVAAISSRAVAFVQNDLRPADFNVSTEQIQAFIDQFSLDYDQVVARFGPPSDVDGDNKVAFLFTHLVDEIEDVGGFYNAEVVLPINAGGTGDSIDLMFISPTRPADSYRSLLVHEFQHLVNFNQHVLVHRGVGEESWLNEGLSHLSEDLVSNPGDNGNLRRATAFLAAPSAVGLEGLASFDTAKRGAAYLFVRSLVDRLGDGVLSRLVQTDRFDRDNIEAATGESFQDLIALWAAQLYAVGTATDLHPRLSFSFAPLLRDLPDPTSSDDFSGSLRPRGLTYIRLQEAGPTLSLQTDPRGHFGAVLLPLFQVSTAIASDPSPLPTAFGLEPNHPNPFNSSTIIPFRLNQAGTVRLAVFSLMGQRIKTLVHRQLPAGPHHATWDGTDTDGKVVSSGVYLTRLEAGPRRAEGKVLLLK